ncbi:hypothetical protein ACNTMW_24205 [Planosporangium sp. 12N6]|uniref:hypothetical protein n=1 Tax=Planosporangium spinosum TaxID=3402278 RepID=UPI003CEC6438
MAGDAIGRTATQKGWSSTRGQLSILPGTAVSDTHETLVIRTRFGGRPIAITAEILCAARDMLPNLDISVTAIARLIDVNPGTFRNIPDLRDCGRPTMPGQRHPRCGQP